MSRLELDLLEYIHTREAVIEREVDVYGPVGAHERVSERTILQEIRAIMDGQPLPGSGAE
jgi:hypothetical protein